MYLFSQIKKLTNQNFEVIAGVIICICNILGIIHWFYTDVPYLLAKDSPAICWPIFENCESIKFFTGEQISYLFAILFIIFLINIIIFFSKKHFRLACSLLLILFFVKYMIVFSDYRLRLNQHYMLLWVSLAYFLFSNSKDIIKLLLVLFYFFAGSIKLNWDWISGASLYTKPWFFEGNYLIAACVWVVVLELILVWGLLLKNRKIKYFVLLQLFLFHLFSFPIVGFFYPLLMYSLLSLFLFSNDNFKKSDLFKPSSMLFIGLFCILQLVPYLSKGESDFTGQGRLVALHMFDNKIQCDASLKIYFLNSDIKIETLNIPVAQRIKCDPIIYYHIAKDVCRRKLELQVNDIDLKLVSYKLSDFKKFEIIDQKKFCNQNPHYSIWGFNSWIDFKEIN